jgi:hypothetical protein
VETNWICRPGCYLYTVAQRAYMVNQDDLSLKPDLEVKFATGSVQAKVASRWAVSHYITWHAFVA